MSSISIETEKNAKSMRFFLVIPHRGERASLKRHITMLYPGSENLSFPNATTAIERLNETRLNGGVPDVVITDLQLPEGREAGLDVTQATLDLSPRPFVIMTTVHVHDLRSDSILGMTRS